MSTSGLARIPVKQSLISKFADRYEVEAESVLSIISATVFKQGKDEAPLTPDEVAAAMIVCNQYELNPFTKEIYAFRSKGKLLIIVSIDGWCTLINRQSSLDGIEFTEHFSEQHKRIDAVTCKIHRSDRRLPIVVTEYFLENVRETDPWRKSPIRMLRHRALIQCARYAFSISGIVDEDEAERIEGEGVRSSSFSPNGQTIEGSVSASTAPPALIDRAQAKEFGDTYKASGHSVDEARTFLKEKIGVDSSLKITLDRFAEVMTWARTPKAAPLAAEISPGEKEARDAMGYIGFNAKEAERFITQYGGDWEKVCDEANAILAKRDAEQA